MAITAVMTARMVAPAAARPAVAAQVIDENASAKVATREEVCRRRNWLRLAWARNHSWIAVADPAASRMPAAATAARNGDTTTSQARSGENTSAIALST